MILEEATFEAFGHRPSSLSCGSEKLILVACELCGEFRVTSKHAYCTFCRSCSHILGEALVGINRTFTEEHKENLGKNHADQKGDRNNQYNKTPSKETRALISAKAKGRFKGKKHPMFGKRGSDSPNYKGGKKVYIARSHAKRKRELGYTLSLPLKEGEVGHHFTDEDVVGIPEEVHVRFSGYKRIKHRALVLMWLKNNDRKKYEIVLRVLG